MRKTATGERSFGEGRAYRRIGEGKAYRRVGEGRAYRRVGEGRAYRRIGEGRAYRRVGVSACRRIGVSAYRRSDQTPLKFRTFVFFVAFCSNLFPPSCFTCSRPHDRPTQLTLGRGFPDSSPPIDFSFPLTQKEYCRPGFRRIRAADCRRCRHPQAITHSACSPAKFSLLPGGAEFWISVVFVKAR
jgi:hypothetical protein